MINLIERRRENNPKMLTIVGGTDKGRERLNGMIGITPAASHLAIFTAGVGGGTAKGNGEVCQRQTRAAVGRRWKSWKRWKISQAIFDF
ncbi:hypothetical protein LXL04_011995 [Taraxacum kok-saghyz]